MPAAPPTAALHFPATQRNREPIRSALADVLPATGTVLEIASGSGEHAAFLAPFFENLTWQPSDRDPTLLASIAAHAAASGAANIAPPVAIDVGDRPWPITAAVAVVAINLIHIAPWQVCLDLLAGAAAILPAGGPLFLYGPFRRDGRHTAPSNEAFDRSLRHQDPAWGVRDLADVEAAAAFEGFRLDRVIEMPANNLGVVFRKA
jgi:hypothetical protein